VYLVVFKMRFPGYSTLDYVQYVFCGLIPYIGFSEAIMAGCVSIRQNIHLVKNVILPIELIPVRAVATSMPSQLVSLAILLLLACINGSLEWRLLPALPLVLLLQLLFLVGLVLILAPLAVALPDLVYFVNLSLLLMMFVSPIGFKPEMIPSAWSFTVYVNPIYYMTEMYRISILKGNWPYLLVPPVFACMCLLVFQAGSAFFRRFKGILVDYE
jgi:lipopolysaccharide transport system permease protein